MGKKLYAGSCIVLVVLIISILGWSYIRVTGSKDMGSFQVEQNNNTKTDSQGPVTVSAKWLNPKDFNVDSLEFELTMDTHSINLEEYDIIRNTEVYVDNLTISSGLEVEKLGAGHHVNRVLKVPIKNTGTVIDLKQVKTIKLVLKELGNIPQRILVWNVSP